MLKRTLVMGLLILMLVITVLPACGGGGGDGDDETDAETPSKETPATGDKGSDIDDPEIRALLNPPEVSEPDPSSYELLDAAVTEGTISEGQSMGFKLIAGYESDKLPEQYQSDIAGRGRLQEAKVWLVKNWDSLDSVAQDELRPYYVSPDDPESYLNQGNETVSSAPNEAGFVLCNNPPAAGWSHIIATISESPVRRAKIFYESGSASATQQAEWAKNAFIKSYPMHESLLGVQPAPMIYIYIQSMSDYGTGYWNTKDGEYRGVIELQAGMNKKMTESTTTHELFHVFQFDMGLDYEPNDEKWLMEATATWSEHYVYPDYNSEHEYLKGFFYFLNNTMIHFGSNREYSTYVWYLFLTQYMDTALMVKKALEDAKTMTATDAAQNINFFDNTFAEYAVWNWNQDPTKKYQDVPDLPGNPKVGGYGASYSSYEYDTEDEFPETVYLPRLSMSYHACIFGEDIKKVVFKFNELGDEEWQKQALVKIGDIWHREDWTYLNERMFCRERENEKVKAVVLIHSNSSDSTPGDETYVIDTQGECTPAWHGTTHIQWAASNNFNAGADVIKSLQKNGSCITFDELEQDYEGNMTIRTRNISYYSYNNDHVDYGSDCGDIWQYNRDIHRGSHFFDYRDSKNPPEIWDLEEDWDTEIVTGINFNPPQYSSNSAPDWYSTLWTQAALARGCVWRGEQFNFMELDDRDNYFDIIDEFYIEEIPDEDHPLEGTYTKVIEDYYLYGNFTITVTYSYRYG